MHRTYGLILGIAAGITAAWWWRQNVTETPQATYPGTIIYSNRPVASTTE